MSGVITRGRRRLTAIERVVGLEAEQVLLETLWSRQASEVDAAWS